MFLSKTTSLFLRKNPWSNTYGLARSLIALGTVLTLCFNDVNTLFKPVAGVIDCPQCYGISEISIFCLFKPVSLNIAKWLSIGVLLLVISGWRPRITGVLHWWITFSFFTASSLLDGGDQVATVLTLLLIPLTLTDSRYSHWATEDSSKNRNPYLRIIANSTFVVIRLQVAVIYFHSAISKMAIREWLHGTALYYFLQDPLFAEIHPSLLSIFKIPFILTSLTWGVLIFELALFIGFFIRKKQQIPLLYLGLGFHLLIMFTFGLVSFFCSMAAALILLLGPLAFDLKRITIPKIRCIGDEKALKNAESIVNIPEVTGFEKER